jgi:soluble lytic murein transglycosylase
MTAKRRIAVLLIALFAVLGVKEIVYNVTYPVVYKDYIIKYSDEYNIDPHLLMAIIKTESRYDKNATSHKGAIGLMQLTEPTADWIAVSMGNANFSTNDLYDPETNIKMGAWYINNIRQEFGSVELILAAYNAGRGNVKKWIGNSTIAEDGKDLDNIPYAETEKYVKKVLSSQKIYKILYPMS